MQYDIKLTIGYVYGAPSDHARTLVRLLPTDVVGRQIVRSRLLTVTPRPDERREAHDFFGNAMCTMVFHAPIDRIELTLRASAERLQQAEGLDLSPDLPGLAREIAADRRLDGTAPHHFIGPSVRVPVVPEIEAFARAQVALGMTTLQVVERIGRALHAEMRFETGATDVNTPTAEAFANRHGVCQDFTHIMIAALRALGVPAGYVSGFLRTHPPPGQPRLEGADAMHAWVMAWCGAEMGWVEFDPSNCCQVYQDHITIAFGRDYSDIAPVKGVLRTSGAQDSHHSVDVIPLDG